MTENHIDGKRNGHTPSYRDAVECFIKTYKAEPLFDPELERTRIEKMKQYISRLQISLDELDKLNIIHITGTKGKGSTTTFTESILRQHGYKTGMYQSPHQIEVRERYKINGRPIPREMFTRYFFEVHTKLQNTKEQYSGDIPLRRAFYTVLGTYIFLKENIDVMVMEVVIGGQNDETNFIQRPWVCALTNVALDHTEVLGDTIEKIAWQKAGIFKPGARAFIGQMMKPSVMDVVLSRAKEAGIHVWCVPKFSSYDVNREDISLGISGEVHRLNASLALQISQAWIDRRNGKMKNKQRINDVADTVLMSEPFRLTKPMIEGIKSCSLICRSQIIRKKEITYYIDGSHTLESIQQCADWFKTTSNLEEKNISGKVVKILMLHLPVNRNPQRIFVPLVNDDLNFDAVLFCSNNCYPDGDYIDREPCQLSFEDTRNALQRYMHAWHQLKGTEENEERVFYSIRDALVWATQGRDPYVLRNPSEELYKHPENGTAKRSLEWQNASKNDTAKDIPLNLRDARHIQIFATGGFWYTGGCLKLVSEDLERF